jgi:hypothetical protein
MSVIEINRGSDLRFTGTWRDETGAPMDMTGYSIAVYDATFFPPGSEITVAWVDASLGQYEAELQWSDSLPLGQVLSFRLRVSLDGEDRTSPAIGISIK